MVDRDFSAEKEALLREHLQRMKAISRRSVSLTAALGVFNTRMIFHCANARAPDHVRVPEDEIKEFTKLLTQGWDDDDVKVERDAGGDSEAGSGD